ncbi:hypothetical protein CP532_3476 [Ophiocordyceps camponoti-leonardi (nom. inval.)]|nr:hypothetical protein CP532_3476 [Ophiocordyceps camponoti-leonardi (nom. inval.)]
MRLSLLLCLASAALGLAGHQLHETQSPGLQKRGRDGWSILRGPLQWITGNDEGYDTIPDTLPNEEQRKRLRMPVTVEEFCAFHRGLGWFAWHLKNITEDEKEKDMFIKAARINKGIFAWEKLVRLMDTQLRNTPYWSKQDQLAGIICYPNYIPHENAFLKALQQLGGKFPEDKLKRASMADALDGLRTCREVASPLTPVKGEKYNADRSQKSMVRRLVHSRHRENRLFSTSFPDPPSKDSTGRAKFLSEIIGLTPRQNMRRHMLIRENCCPYNCNGSIAHARDAWKKFPPRPTGRPANIEHSKPIKYHQ